MLAAAERTGFRRLASAGLLAWEHGGTQRVCAARMLVTDREHAALQPKAAPWGLVFARSYASLPEHKVLTLPSLSPTMETGSITRWLVKEGDQVNEGDVIAEVETDKAVVGFDVQDGGVMAKILRKQGDAGIAVGEPVCVMVEDAADVAAFKDYQPDSASSSPQPASPDPAPSTSAPSESTSAPPKARDPRSDRVGPAVRMLLEEHGLSQFDVNPSGPRDIVTKGDVLAAVAAGVKPGAKTAPPPAPEPSASAPKAAAAPSPPPPKPAPPPPAPAESTAGRRKRGEQFKDIPNSSMRRVIAKRLLESKLTTPSIYVSQEAELTALTQLRAALKESGIKVSVNDFVIKAAAMALRAVPAVCAGWDTKAESVIDFPSIDISIAVATPGGLITPIVTNADKKSLTEISKAVKDLAGRARENKLQPQEFTGGAFTISNLGMFGIDNFAAIINPPQSSILAVGGTQHKTILVDGKINTIEHMTVTLSSDNRVVGAESAAEFLKAFARNIENPGVMLVT